MIRVGEKDRSGRIIPYQDVGFDKETGWADAEAATPLAFDVVKLKTETKNINGWWTGSNWFSLRLRPYDKVTKWQRLSEVS